MSAPYTKDPLQLGTGQYPFDRSPFPWNPDDKFNKSTLGVIGLGNAVTAPNWNTYGHAITPATSGPDKDQPINQPADCVTAGGWWMKFSDSSDMALLVPYAVGFNSLATPTAYAAPAAGESYQFSFWLVRRVRRYTPNTGPGFRNRTSWIIVPGGRVTLTTGATGTGMAMQPNEREFCTGGTGAVGLMMSAAVVNEDYTLSPGIRVLGGGAANPGPVVLAFDKTGAEGMIVYPHVMPALRGLGLLPSQL